VSHALAHPHGLSMIELEHNLKSQGKPEYPISKPDSSVLADSAFAGSTCNDGDRANFHPSGIWVREGKDRG
jgi:hypothetical protein